MARPPSDAPPDEGFLARWSRRKDEACEEETVPPPQPAAPPQGDAEPATFDPADLPSLDSLGKESDYSMFMRQEVPEALRQQALRKLWALDPLAAVPDPLDMYNLDFNAPSTFVGGVRTSFRIGLGMIDAEEEKKRLAAEAAHTNEAAKEPIAEVASDNAAAQQEPKPT